MPAAADAVYSGREMEGELVLGRVHNVLALNRSTNTWVLWIEVDQGNWDFLSHFVHESLRHGRYRREL